MMLTSIAGGTRDAGNGAVTAMVMLVVVSALAIGGAVATAGVTRYARRALETAETDSRLEEAVTRVLEVLSADPTPESDSQDDPVWDLVTRPTDVIDEAQLVVTLADVSSRVNPNTVRKNLLERTGLGDTVFSGGVFADRLGQYREDEGLSSDIGAHYGDIFRPEAFEALLTGFGWANVNVSDEFVLRKLYAERTGRAVDAEAFRSKIQSLIAQESMMTPAALPTFLGPDYERVFPVVNAEPLWNVHFLPEVVLREVLAYEALGVDSPNVVASNILTLRRGGTIRFGELLALTGLPEDSRLHQYMGVRTWFWKVEATAGGRQLTVVVARVPGRAGRLQIVSRRLEAS